MPRNYSNLRGKELGYLPTDALWFMPKGCGRASMLQHWLAAWPVSTSPTTVRKSL